MGQCTLWTLWYLFSPKNCIRTIPFIKPGYLLLNSHARVALKRFRKITIFHSMLLWFSSSSIIVILALFPSALHLFLFIKIVTSLLVDRFTLTVYRILISSTSCTAYYNTKIIKKCTLNKCRIIRLTFEKCTAWLPSSFYFFFTARDKGIEILWLHELFQPSISRERAPGVM